MLRNRVWAHLCTHGLREWCSGRTFLCTHIPLALLSLEAHNLAMLSLGILQFISSLPVGSWDQGWNPCDVGDTP